MTSCKIQSAAQKAPQNWKCFFKSIPIKKNPGPTDFTDKSYHILKEEIMPILYKLFPQTEEYETHSSLLYVASITQKLKLDKEQVL